MSTIPFPILGLRLISKPMKRGSNQMINRKNIAPHVYHFDRFGLLPFSIEDRIFKYPIPNWWEEIEIIEREAKWKT